MPLYCPQRAARLLSLIALIPLIAKAQPLDDMALREAIQGCWEYEKPDPVTGRATPLTSILACLNHEGVITGVTFNDGDGWEWIHSYSIQNGSVIVEGEVWWTIEDVGGGRLIVVKNSGERRIYRHVCRTVEQDIQCERLKYKIEPQ
jgi:hypothetical protein